MTTAIARDADAVALASLREDTLGALRRLADSNKPVIRVVDAPTTTLIVVNANLVAAVLLDRREGFVKQPNIPRQLRFLVGDGTATAKPVPVADSDRSQESISAWRQRRHDVVQPWLAGAKRGELGDVVERAVGEAFRGLGPGGHADARELGFDIAIDAFLHQFASESSRTVMRRLAEVVRDTTAAVDRCVRRPNAWPFDRDVGRSARMLALLPGHAGIRRRQRAFRDAFGAPPPGAAADATAFSDLQASAREFGIVARERQTAIGASFFLAAHENTTTAAAWLLWFLAGAPEVVERVRAEAREADRVPASKRSWTVGAVNETLRLRPPVWSLTRTTLRAFRLGGMSIPAGTLLVLSPVVQHHRSRLWPSPDDFDPGRFVDRPRPPIPGSFYPFGIGAGRCQGANVATTELASICAVVADRFDLQRTGGHDPGVRLGSVARPAGALPIRVSPRS